MNTWSTYFLDTGLFTGFALGVPTDSLDANIHDECGCIIGVYDPLSQRVDVVTGLVVDYQPPRPSPDYAWDNECKRWLYVKTDADIAAEVRAARDTLIASCDWVMMRALDDGTARPAAWVAYRRTLREITLQPGFPRNITWPIAPN